jgi:hypothetical protein|tara:strand:+ start:1425 stop:1577 length:153 start_codon:yes stop_codon:yes gene_type:complete
MIRNSINQEVCGMIGHAYEKNHSVEKLASTIVNYYRELDKETELIFGDDV